MNELKKKCMQAGEEFIKSNLQAKGTVPEACRSSAQAAMVQSVC